MKLKAKTNYTIAFDYNTSSEATLRLRKIFDSTTVSFFEGSGRACVTVNTGSGTQHLSFDPTRGKVATGGSSKIGDWIEVSNLILVEGSYDELPYYPAPEDYGVVHGQPNLINGTSNEWEESTFSGYTPTGVSKSFTLASLGLSVGDTVSYCYEADNTADGNKDAVRAVIAFKDKNLSTLYYGTTVAGNSVSAGVVGYAKTEGIITDNVTNIQVDLVNKASNSNVATVKRRRNKLIKGSLAAMDDWTPSQADFEGLPNLLDGTMGTWQDFSFTGWHWSTVRLLLGEDFNIGDTFTLTSEIDNKASMPLYVRFAFATADNVVTYANSNQISAGSTGVATVTTTVPSNCAILYVHLVVKGDSTSTATGRVRKIKLVKGDKSQLGIWTPKSRTEYDKTLGVVPFTQPDYDTLQSADGIVRAETTIVGRGAEILFDFPVIETLEKRYPYLFEGITTMSDKITEYLSLVKKVEYVEESRGGGLFSSTGQAIKFSKPYIKVTNNTGTFWGLSPFPNSGSTFEKLGTIFSASTRKQLNKKGSYTIYSTSKKNSFTEPGTVSDGVTPAWVEVKDIYLEVSIQPPEDSDAELITIKVTPSQT